MAGEVGWNIQTVLDVWSWERTKQNTFSTSCVLTALCQGWLCCIILSPGDQIEWRGCRTRSLQWTDGEGNFKHSCYSCAAQICLHVDIWYYSIFLCSLQMSTTCLPILNSELSEGMKGGPMRFFWGSYVAFNRLKMFLFLPSNCRSTFSTKLCTAVFEDADGRTEMKCKEKSPAPDTWIHSGCVN